MPAKGIPTMKPPNSTASKRSKPLSMRLRSLGHSTDRIGHGRALLRRLVKGDRWDMVFNIAEGLHGFGREALVPALLDTYENPYTFSDPLTLCVALHKATAKHVVRDQGISHSGLRSH